jgi:hypothetical protein
MGHEKSAVGASEFRPDGAEIGWPPSRPEPFRVEAQTGRDRTAVAPVGELDLATAGPLQDALNELEAAGSERLVLDLRRVSFMDWWGLRTERSALICVLDRPADGWRSSAVPDMSRDCSR